MISAPNNFVYLAFLALYWLDLPFISSSPGRLDHNAHIIDDDFDKLLIDTIFSDDAYDDQNNHFGDVMDDNSLPILDIDPDELSIDTLPPGETYHDIFDGPVEVMDDNSLDSLDYLPDELSVDTPSPGNTDGLGEVKDHISLESLDFHPDEYLEKHHKSRYKGQSRLINCLQASRKFVVDYFRNQLLQNGIMESKIPWSKLTKKDFINWPDSIPIKNPNGFNSAELEPFKMELENIRFSDEYLEDRRLDSRFINIFNRNRKEVSDFFKQLYNDRYNDNRKNMPWFKIKREDFEWFPEDVDLVYSKWKNVDFEKILNVKDRIKLKKAITV